MQWTGERLCNIVCSLDIKPMTHYQKGKIIFRKRDYSTSKGGCMTWLKSFGINYDQRVVLDWEGFLIKTLVFFYMLWYRRFLRLGLVKSFNYDFMCEINNKIVRSAMITLSLCDSKHHVERVSDVITERFCDGSWMSCWEISW